MNDSEIAQTILGHIDEANMLIRQARGSGIVVEFNDGSSSYRGWRLDEDGELPTPRIWKNLP